MPSEIAAVGALYYDAEDLQLSDLQIFFEIERGLDEVPSVRGKDSIVPAAAGRTERNRKNDVLSIVLRGWVSSDPTLEDSDADASFRYNLASVRSLFAPDRARAYLTAVLEDGSIQRISARPMNIIAGRNTVAKRFRPLSIELEGYDDWEAVTT